MARVNHNRSQLLVGCASAALAMGLAFAPQAAKADAFQATETVVTGAINRIDTGTGTETIEVFTDTAVIDWVPDEDGAGNALDFLPTNSTATFQNGPNNADFAVLNRILPSTNGNVAVFDGTVISQLVDALGGNPVRGGTVAFYSPTGIFVGGNATFDVGNLILTTLEPDLASFDDFALNGGQLQLSPGDGTNLSIEISPGASFVATEENSYLAVIGADIQMLGTTQINGSQAFIAGEQVNITVTNGLFDIEIPFGTSSTTPIIIDGDIGGPSSTGIGDNHLIYAVAAAQTDPISLLFSGNLGFDTAASAGIINGEIILSANHEVFGRQVDGGSVSDGINALFDQNNSLTDTAGSIFLEDFNSSSTILAIANEEVQVTALNAPSSVDGNLIMVGRNFSELTATNGQTFDISGDVYVSAQAYGEVDIDPFLFEAIGGTAFIDGFNGGAITISGNALVDASAVAGADAFAGVAGAATGGSATIASTGGTVDILGSAEVFANASEAQIGIDYFFGNDFTAGTAQIFASQDGAVTIAGPTDVRANATGTNNFVSFLTNIATASNATGGQAFVQAVDADSSLNFQSGLTVQARAEAGLSNDAAQGGVASGGDAFVGINNGGVISVTDALVIDAVAIAGSNQGGSGGDAIGGAARAFVPNGGTLSAGLFSAEADGIGGSGIGGGMGEGGIAGAQVIFGNINIAGSATVRARGFGGGPLGFGGDGGTGIGGNSFLQANGTLNDAANFTIDGFATLDSSGVGGSGGDGGGTPTQTPGRGGDGIGGAFSQPNPVDSTFNNGAFLLAGGDNGNLTVGGQANVISIGTAGRGGNGIAGQAGGLGGDGFGGTAQVGSALLGGDGSLGSGEVLLGTVFANASGIGGAGGFGDGANFFTANGFNGNGGNGQGGGAFWTARAGLVDAGDVTLRADARGGEGEQGGAATGGQSVVTGSFGASIVASTVLSSAFARGGNGASIGGNAQGGSALLLTDPMAPDSFALTVNGPLTFDAQAFGGTVVLGLAGNAVGGQAEIDLQADDTQISVSGDLQLLANAIADESSSGATGASATGGTALLNADSASPVLVSANLIAEANANGGSNIGVGPAGDAIGGSAEIIVDNGGGVMVDGSLFASARAAGDDGVGGGNAFGGAARVRAFGGSIAILGSATADASAEGGNAASPAEFGGDGGIGQGGLAEIYASGTDSLVGVIDIGLDAIAIADGTGGTGGLGSGTMIAAGAGGDGIGGDLETPLAIDPMQFGGALVAGDAQNGTINVLRNVVVSALGTGGDGGNGGLDQAGGDGGNGIGGDAGAGVLDSRLDPVSPGIGFANITGDVSVNGSGIGGAGGFGGSTADPRGNGGDGTGDRALVFVEGGGTLSANIVTATASGTGGEGAIGGSGSGGPEAGISMNFNAVFDIGSFQGDASGIGGQGTGGAGGEGQGGFAFIDFQDGVGDIADSALLIASGIGGNSDGGDGGDGTGGQAEISIPDLIPGDGTIGGFASVEADGSGGAGGSGFAGGVGTGGLAFVQALAGGSITIDHLAISADGTGGSGAGAEASAGIGGTAFIEARDSGTTIDILNDTFTSGMGINLISATGFGGVSQGGTGVGGNGVGGDAQISAVDGATVTLAPDPNILGLNRIVARGTGGGSEIDGGAGGNAVGGTARLFVDGGTLDTGPALLSAFAFGGTNFDIGVNTNGGDGEGGIRDVTVINGGTLTTSLRGGVAGGTGGDGSGTGDGGNGTGGIASLTVTDSTANFIGRSIILVQPFGGSGVNGGNADGSDATTTATITNSTINILPDADGNAELAIGANSFGGFGQGGPNLTGGVGIGGTAQVNIVDSVINGGSLLVSATGQGGGTDTLNDAFQPNGNIGVGGNGTAGVAELNVIGSDLNLEGGETVVNGILVRGGLRVEANGSGGSGTTSGNAQGGSALLDLNNTTLDVAALMGGTSRIDVSANALAGIAQDQIGDSSGGNAEFSATDATITSDQLNITAGGSTAAGSSPPIPLGGEALGGSVQATIVGNSDVSLSSFLASATVGSAIGGTADGGVVSVLIGGSGGIPTLDATDFFVVANGASGDSTTAGVFDIQVESGLLSTNSFVAEALGDLPAPSSPPSLISANGGDILVVETMDVDVAASIEIAAGQGNLIGGPDLIDPTADITVRSQEVITIIGDDDNAIDFAGNFMTLESRDIDVQDGARFGAVELELVSLNDITGAAIIGGVGGSGGSGGGPAMTGGYELDAAEVARIEAGNFTFTQPILLDRAVNDPDIILRDVTAIGSATDGTSSIIVRTVGDINGIGGTIRVEGSVQFTDVAPTDTFTLSATNGRIEVVTPGGISVLDAGGNPSGDLFLAADNVWVADSDLIALLQDDQTFAGRDDELAQAALGSDDPLGYVQGGTVTFEVGNSLLIRNTGTSTEQGGVLVGDGGLSIFGVSSPTSEGELDVFAYGARLDSSSGALITGEDFFNEVNFDNASGSTFYLETSEFNDCVINTGDCGNAVDPPDTPDPVDPPSGQEEVTPEVEEAVAAVNNPSVIEAAVSATQPVATTEQETNDDFGIDFPGLVESEELEEEGNIEDPVASGGDSSLYGPGNAGSVRVEGN